jgi:ribonuclease HI
MNVTIMTDASFSRVHRKGSYAFYIKSDKGTISRDGMLRGDTKHALVAEIKAIYNAVYHLIFKSGWMEEVSVIYVNTDCMNAIHLLTKDKKNIEKYNLKHHKEQMRICNLFSNMMRDHAKGIKINFYHVKAHQHTDTPRNYVNDQLDQKAKKHISKLHENSNLPTGDTRYCRPSFTVKVRSAIKK